MKKYFYLIVAFLGMFFVGFTNLHAVQRVNVIQYSGGTLTTTGITLNTNVAVAKAP